MNMKITRTWANPNSETFSIRPIEGFVRGYLANSKVSVDIFARNKRWATHTNDLNPDTSAQHHLDAEEFCLLMQKENVVADLIIFDPPYSPRQISECYKGIGRTVTMQDTQNSALYSRVRKAFKPLVPAGGIVLSFGWNTHGMSNNGHAEWEILEIMMVCHGGAHNDTICMAERRVALKPDVAMLL